MFALISQNSQLLDVSHALLFLFHIEIPSFKGTYCLTLTVKVNSTLFFKNCVFEYFLHKKLLLLSPIECEVGWV